MELPRFEGFELCASTDDTIVRHKRGCHFRQSASPPPGQKRARRITHQAECVHGGNVVFCADSEKEGDYDAQIRNYQTYAALLEV